MKDGSEVDFTLKVTPMDDEVPYAEEFNQISKFTFKTECRGVSCLLNEIYEPEPQTIALFAGLLAILFLAVYRRGRYNSSNYLIEEVPQELEMESDEGLDIPEPVSEDSLEDDDDLELLDALDEI